MEAMAAASSSEVERVMGKETQWSAIKSVTGYAAGANSPA